jgi:alpha-N-arabinofuranosidase
MAATAVLVVRPTVRETPVAPDLFTDAPTLASALNQSAQRDVPIRNAGFENGGSPVPDGWMRDSARTGNKGSVSVDRTHTHSGRASLRLQPNSRNGGDFPLAVAQVIPGSAYRGKRVEFSATMFSTGGATAVLGMLHFVGSRGADLVTVAAEGSHWAWKSQTYDVPDEPSVQLVITCYVTGQAGTAWFDDVSIKLLDERPSGAAGAAALAPRAILKAKAEVDATAVVRRIPRTLYGANLEWIWNGNFFWKESTGDLDPDAIRLTRDLGVSLIRYPGGQYSDFYHWQRGIGHHDQRPDTLHAAGKGDRSRPNFGTDEALHFAEQARAELLITVNAGTGDPREAAEWVRYVNRTSQRVRFWEVGNELYMNEGSATSRAITMSPSRYANRLVEFVREMKTADPSIKVGAIGGENHGRYINVNYPDWNRTILERASDQIDFLAVHNAYSPVLITGDDQDMRKVYRAMLASPVLIARNLRTVEKQIADYAPARASHIAIAVTEWGPLFQFDPASRYVDHGKTLGSALFVASALKAFIESPRTEIANFFLLNDMSVLGLIGSRRGDFPPNPDWAPTARYFAIQMYTRYFGDQLVRTDTTVAGYDSEAVGLVDPVANVPYLDVVSSLSADGSRLHIIAVNKHFDSSIETSISLRGFSPAAVGTAWTLTGTGIDAHTGTTPLRVPNLPWGRQIEDPENPRFYSKEQDAVTLSSAPFPVGEPLTYRFPPHSVTSLILTRANRATR